MIPRRDPELLEYQRHKLQQEAKRACGDRHDFRWGEPYLVRSEKLGFPSYRVRATCSRCGEWMTRPSRKRVRFEPGSWEANEQGIRLLARHGVRFVKIAKPGSKFPPLNGWDKRAPSDLLPVEVLSQRYLGGELNYAAVASRTVVAVDMDSRTSFERCLQVPGFRTRTLRVQTPRGQHAWWKLPSGTKLTKRQGDSGFGPGIDVQTAGAYCVGIGGWIDPRLYTKHGEELVLPRYRYTVIQLPEKNELPEIPADVLEHCLKAESAELDGRATARTAPESGGSADRTTATVAVADPAAVGTKGRGGSSAWRELIGVDPESIEEGQRDSWLFGNLSAWTSMELQQGRPPSLGQIVGKGHELNRQLAQPLSVREIEGKGQTCWKWGGILADLSL